MSTLLAGLLTLSLAQADEQPPPTSDGRQVILEDDGPTRMDDKREYRNLITPGVTLWPPGVKGRFQHLVTDNLSVMVGGGIGGGAASTCDCEGLGWARWQVIAGADYHPIGNGMHGLYLGPRVLYRHGGSGFSALGSDVSTEYDMVVYRGIIGYRWIWDPGLSAAVGVGGGYRQKLRTYSVDGEATDDSLLTQLIVPSLEFNLSWAF